MTETTETQAFVDVSPFQGWKQFENRDGEEFRVEYTGRSRKASFFRKSGGGFVCIAKEVSLEAPAKSMSCEHLYYAMTSFLESIENSESE